MTSDREILENRKAAIWAQVYELEDNEPDTSANRRRIAELRVEALIIQDDLDEDKWQAARERELAEDAHLEAAYEDRYAMDDFEWGGES